MRYINAIFIWAAVITTPNSITAQSINFNGTYLSYGTSYDFRNEDLPTNKNFTYEISFYKLNRSAFGVGGVLGGGRRYQFLEFQLNLMLLTVGVGPRMYYPGKEYYTTNRNDLEGVENENEMERWGSQITLALPIFHIFPYARFSSDGPWKQEAGLMLKIPIRLYK